MKPPKSILDRSFQYTPSAQTDLAKTFRRVRKEQERENRTVTPLFGAAREKKEGNR